MCFISYKNGYGRTHLVLEMLTHLKTDFCLWFWTVSIELFKSNPCLLLTWEVVTQKASATAIISPHGFSGSPYLPKRMNGWSTKVQGVPWKWGLGWMQHSKLFFCSTDTTVISVSEAYFHKKGHRLHELYLYFSTEFY